MGRPPGFAVSDGQIVRIFSIYRIFTCAAAPPAAAGFARKVLGFGRKGAKEEKERKQCVGGGYEEVLL